MLLFRNKRPEVQCRCRLIALSLLIAIFLTAACSRPQERYVRFLKIGNQQMEKGDYSRAALNFRNSIQAQPKNAEAYYRLALADLAVGQVREGVSALRRATELNPAHHAAQLKLAELMIRTHDVEIVKDAEGRIQKVLAENPEDNDALFDLAAVQTQLGKPEEAEQYLNSLLERLPESLKSAIGLAQIKLSKKDFKGAEDVMTNFARRSPMSADAAVALGVVYAAMGNLASAEFQVRKRAPA